jgi:hypothetical protein
MVAGRAAWAFVAVLGLACKGAHGCGKGVCQEYGSEPRYARDPCPLCSRSAGQAALSPLFFSPPPHIPPPLFLSPLPPSLPPSPPSLSLSVARSHTHTHRLRVSVPLPRPPRPVCAVSTRRAGRRAKTCSGARRGPCCTPRLPTCPMSSRRTRLWPSRSVCVLRVYD